jgi:hypothetical protein
VPYLGLEVGGDKGGKADADKVRFVHLQNVHHLVDLLRPKIYAIKPLDSV